MRVSVWLGAVLLFCSGQFLSAQEVASVHADVLRTDAVTTAPMQTVTVETTTVETAPAKAAATESVTVMPSSEPLINPEDVMNGGNLIFQQQDEPVLVAPDSVAYQFYIADLEGRHGAYAPGLSEQLLGLGSVYQEQGLYQEAIKIFKRAVHLSRISNGLHSAEQIPILQRLISALVSSGDYEKADERQYYLYRVQRQLYQSDAPQMSKAMMDRANWERQAYYLSVGDTAFSRLLAMWELYRRVLSNIAETEGSYSLQLLQPLNGLLETQYLIARYNGEAPGGIQFGSGAPESSAEKNRFAMVRLSNYKQGQAVIAAIREVHLFNESEESPLAAESLLALGDWRQYHGKREAAGEAYLQAWDELAVMENSEQLLAQHFGQPQLLPTTADAHLDLAPPANIKGYAEVSYSVNQRGRVKALELVSNEPVEAHPNAEPTRLLRRIKAKKFRPRYENREPVTTENLVKSYAY
ncbi:MAG: tetratricopeptide repeat protein [Gammaproteobacteria bacterium]|nr:tetratricopeptide repeat protein [Gammaproteobacteria bacterium]